MNPSPVELFNKIFISREKAHIFHFQKENYEIHIATEFYYEKIIKLFDSLVEIYQGKYGIVKDYDLIVKDDKGTDPVKYFEELVHFIEKERYNYIKKEDTFIHNILDEIVSLIYRTIFKLKYLK